MTLKEAIFRSLDDIGQSTKGAIANNNEVCQHIIKYKYYDFKDAKTPASTVSAMLGDYIRNGDTRVKRVKLQGGVYSYYLTKYEQDINVETLPIYISEENNVVKLKSTIKGYHERDLHKLLTTYLFSTGVYSKTIFHEQSNTKDSSQKWVHPDMIGIKLNDLQSKASRGFLKAVNREETVKLYSYEIKKEILTDYDLKKYFFQAVSNSSWANQGYLVAFEIDDSLHDEMARLNESFGIGIILLKSNPFESKILFPATTKSLDFKTIDKLCKINNQFERFIEQVEKLITADERYVTAIEKELVEFSDRYFLSDTETELYCKEKNIPYEQPIMTAILRSD